ncbi:helix-turn-helix domain-containing protein [Streptomyces sp. AK010]|uniref:helix-turn-helix domain-containing protein n=1 Tax=Streptomyces sp. AK010 TaxID=2723074 RepID=UPI00161E125B|nr:helix-turn-helix domain-containing protein [Streptomyces sp. AK010]MBB6418717.1 DNA-directed RNA polymerase specialized sigma24 family protein/transcriptional regulator with XRE-family HTH domain [Streptomyces sp. AK010]
MTQSPALPLPPPKERRRLREAASLTRAQLASRVGVTGETVRGWETGRLAPRGRKGEKYARLLNSLSAASEVTPPQDGAADDDTAEPAPPAAASGRSAGARRRASANDRKRPPAAKDRGRGPATVPDHGHTPAADHSRPSAPHHSRAPAPHHSRTAVPHRHRVILTERRRTTPPHRPDDAITALTPDQAFDALYAFCAPALVRQTYLLTGRRELARESVERAFQIAWQRWPEVARDRDPAGWVRAMAYECALSPWHRLRLRHRHPEPPPADAFDRALMDTLLELPPSYRRTLVLYDGVGLGLPETAAETEASTRAAVNRLAHAREALAERLPELADPETLHRRLVELASTERLRAAEPPVVRKDGERRARFWTRAAIAFTVALIGATALTVRTAPTHYEPPVPPGETVQGVPPPVAPGPLSESEQKLRAKLRKEEQKGPDRLLPQLR